MERKSSATFRRWERFGGAADAFARARSVRERSFSTRAARSTTPRNRFQAYPFPPRARDRRRPSAHSQPLATARPACASLATDEHVTKHPGDGSEEQTDEEDLGEFGCGVAAQQGTHPP